MRADSRGDEMRPSMYRKVIRNTFTIRDIITVTLQIRFTTESYDSYCRTYYTTMGAVSERK